MKRLFLTAAFALLSAGAWHAADAAPVLIANKSLAAEPLDASSVKAVFLGRKVAWSNNTRVALAVLKAGPVADEFLKKNVEQSASQFLNHWRRLAMTGGGIAPHSFDTEEELRKYVAETPGAIGFIDDSNVDATVAVVTIGG